MDTVRQRTYRRLPVFFGRDNSEQNRAGDAVAGVMNVGSIIRATARSVLKSRRRIRNHSETALKNRFKTLF